MLLASNVSDSPIDQNKINYSDIVLLNLLGKGATGTVRKAIHRQTKRVLALKAINLKNDLKHRCAVLGEILITLHCDHPSIIKSYGAWVTDSGVAIALEHMSAGSLKSIM